VWYLKTKNQVAMQLLHNLFARRNARNGKQTPAEFIESIDSVKDLGALYFHLKELVAAPKSSKNIVKFCRKIMAKIYEKCVCNAISFAAAGAFARKAGIVPVYAYVG
jgi:hypothetical protein